MKNILDLNKTTQQLLIELSSLVNTNGPLKALHTFYERDEISWEKFLLHAVLLMATVTDNYQKELLTRIQQRSDPFLLSTAINKG